MIMCVVSIHQFQTKQSFFFVLNGKNELSRIINNNKLVSQRNGKTLILLPKTFELAASGKGINCGS